MLVINYTMSFASNERNCRKFSRCVAGIDAIKKHIVSLAAFVSFQANAFLLNHLVVLEVNAFVYANDAATPTTTTITLGIFSTSSVEQMKPLESVSNDNKCGYL